METIFVQFSWSSAIISSAIDAVHWLSYYGNVFLRKRNTLEYPEIVITSRPGSSCQEKYIIIIPLKVINFISNISEFCIRLPRDVFNKILDYYDGTFSLQGKILELQVYLDGRNIGSAEYIKFNQAASYSYDFMSDNRLVINGRDIKTLLDIFKFCRDVGDRCCIVELSISNNLLSIKNIDNNVGVSPDIVVSYNGSSKNIYLDRSYLTNILSMMDERDDVIIEFNDDDDTPVVIYQKNRSMGVLFRYSVVANSISFSVDSVGFRKYLTKALPCLPDYTVSPLCGIFLEKRAGENKLLLTVSNGSFIVRKAFDGLFTSSHDAFDVFLEKNTIKKFLDEVKLLDGSICKFTLSGDGDVFLENISIGKWVIPRINYHRVLSYNYDNNIELCKADISAIKKIHKACSKLRNKYIRFVLNGKPTVQWFEISKDSGLVSRSMNMNVDYCGERHIKLILDVGFLCKIFNIIGKDGILMKFSDSESPVVLQQEETDNYAAIMPLDPNVMEW